MAIFNSYVKLPEGIPCHSDVVPAPSYHGTMATGNCREFGLGTRGSQEGAQLVFGKMWENVNAEAMGFATLVVLVSFRILFGLFSHLVHSFSLQILPGLTNH